MWKSRRALQWWSRPSQQDANSWPVNPSLHHSCRVSYGRHLVVESTLIQAALWTKQGHGHARLRHRFAATSLRPSLKDSGSTGTAVLKMRFFSNALKSSHLLLSCHLWSPQMLAQAPGMRWCTRPLPICSSDRPSDPLATLKQCSGHGKKGQAWWWGWWWRMRIKSATPIISLYIRIKVKTMWWRQGESEYINAVRMNEYMSV